jgi:trimeric autotransporter adhesin
MITSRLFGRSRADRVGWSRHVTRRLCRKGVLAALIIFVVTLSGNLLFAQHTGTASLGVSVAPAVQLTTNDSTNVSLWIRLATGGTGYLWGNSSTSCTSPIGTATTYSTSGMYNNIPLSIVPFSTSNAYVCAYDPGASPSSAYVTWPHSDTSLQFGTQPTNTASGASIVPAVTVQVLDSNGVVDTSSAASVTVAIGTNPVGGTLSGTLTQSAVNGVATFSNLALNRAGTGYTLTATSGSLTTATSSAFNVTGGAATHLVYTTVPSTGTAGTAFSVTVQSQDANGNPASPTSNTTITLSKATGSGTLSGTLTGSISTSANSVTISTPVYSAASTMTLTTAATAGETSLTAVTSGNIVFSAGAIDHFAISAISSPQTAGTAFTITTITAQDTNNNTATSFTSTVTFGGTAGVTGTSGTFTAGVLSGASVTPTVAGSGLTLTVTDSSSHTGSATITTINPGALDHFKVEKSGGGAIGTQTAGTAFSLRITAQDVNNNTVTSFASTASLTSTGTLTGSPVTSGSFVAGILDPQSVTITNTGSFTITATASGKTGTSAAFTVNAGVAAKLIFTANPSSSTGGIAFGTQPQVTVEDANGNTVTSSSASIQLAIGTNPGSGTLTCATNPQNATSGVDTFAGCNINKIGTGYTLTATSSGLTSATSSTFNITLGPAAQLAFTVQPSASTVATDVFAQQPTVTVQDAGGNTVTTSSASITLAITSGTGATGAALTCTANPKNASSGVDAFAGCKIDTGSNSLYTLTATSGGLTSAVSNSFTIQDFSIAVTTALYPNPTPHKSASATATITLTSIGSFTGSVTVSCAVTGPNCGITSPVTVPANGSVNSTLTMSTSGNSTGAGTYTITITGTFGTLSRSVSPSPTWMLD